VTFRGTGGRHPQVGAIARLLSEGEFGCEAAKDVAGADEPALMHLALPGQCCVSANDREYP
jgi:hypothetical protein